jgi:hypothetical protein
MTHFMHWLWLSVAVQVLVYQIIGMSPLGDGWGFSRVMDRILGFNSVVSALIGVFWVWAPIHFLVGRTSTEFGGRYEIGAAVTGALLGILAFLNRRKRL